MRDLSEPFLLVAYSNQVALGTSRVCLPALISATPTADAAAASATAAATSAALTPCVSNADPRSALFVACPMRSTAHCEFQTRSRIGCCGSDSAYLHMHQRIIPNRQHMPELDWSKR